MTNQEKKKWLSRAWDIQKLINEYEREYRREIDRAQKITASYSGGTSGGERDPYKFDRVAEYTEKITETIGRLYLAKNEILKTIEAVPDPVQQRLLMLRYIRSYSWVKIARAMSYSDRDVYYIHGKALSALQIPDNHCSSLQSRP